jgi:DNA repair photolyase
LSQRFPIFESEARSILSPVTGFLSDAGFTHSLSPARNCTFGCTYCYVPTMRVQAGLKAEDWNHWGQRTTFKTNAGALLARALREGQAIYCSPLTDPYQPAEAEQALMRDVLRALAEANAAPRVFVIQTRGPLILRDIDLLLAAQRRTMIRVSFSVTTDREEVRRMFEPHCASLEDRWQTIGALRDAGIPVCATLAPLLPGNAERLLERALEATEGPVIADPFHVREVKRSGATTREAAYAICRKQGWEEWLEPGFQQELLVRLASLATRAGREFGHGPAGFGILAR